MMFQSDWDQQFWAECVVAGLRTGQSTLQAQVNADACLRGLQFRRLSVTPLTELAPLTPAEQAVAKAGERINAIRMYRERTGIALKDARVAVLSYLGVPV